MKYKHLIFGQLAEGDNTVATVDVVGVIGASADEATYFADRLNERKKGGCTSLRLRINSVGGDVYTALAMYDAIRALGIPVRAEVHGLAASAATILLMAADTRVMSPHSRLMVHEASSVCWGKVSDIKAQYDNLCSAWADMVSIYAARCGKTEEEVRAAHEGKDVYYTAEQALAWGLVDAVDAAEEPMPAPPREEEDDDDAEEVSFWGRTAARLAAVFGLSVPRKGLPMTNAVTALRDAQAQIDGLREQLEAAKAEAEAARVDVESRVQARLLELGVGDPVAAPTASDPSDKADTPPALSMTAEEIRAALATPSGRDRVLSFAATGAQARALVQSVVASLKS